MYRTTGKGLYGVKCPQNIAECRLGKIAEIKGLTTAGKHLKNVLLPFSDNLSIQYGFFMSECSSMVDASGSVVIFAFRSFHLQFVVIAVESNAKKSLN